MSGKETAAALRARLALARKPQTPKEIAVVKHAPRQESPILKEGEIVYYEGRRHIVWRVNDCSAWLRPYHAPEIVTIGGEDFPMDPEPEGKSINVSAYSSLERAQPGVERF